MIYLKFYIIYLYYESNIKNSYNMKRVCRNLQSVIKSDVKPIFGGTMYTVNYILNEKDNTVHRNILCLVEVLASKKGDELIASCTPSNMKFFEIKENGEPEQLYLWSWEFMTDEFKKNYNYVNNTINRLYKKGKINV